jgi:hypothetical protein
MFYIRRSAKEEVEEMKKSLEVKEKVEEIEIEEEK